MHHKGSRPPSHKAYMQEERAVPIEELKDSGEGRAHSPWPCTTGSASPAAAARCHRSCHTPCTWHSQADFLPATGEAWRSADQAETCTRSMSQHPTQGHRPWAKMLQNDFNQDTFLTTSRGRTGLSHPHSYSGHSMTTHKDWTELGSTKAHSEPPNAEWEQLKTSRKRTEGEESHTSLASAPVRTPSSSSMMSFPMEASVVHLQLLVARTAHRLWALNLHTVRE